MTFEVSAEIYDRFVGRFGPALSAAHVELIDIAVESESISASADYASFDDYWEPFTAGVGPAGAYCASLPEDRREALRDACFLRLGSPQGPFVLRARAW